MEKILLIMSTSGYEPEVVDHAIKLAVEKSVMLISCYIIDAEVPDAVSSWMIYVGFMGDEPSEDYRTVVLEEYKQRAKETLDEVEVIAKKHQIKIESFIFEGPLLENAVKVAKEQQVDLIVINKPPRMDFGRLLHKSSIDELIKQAPCPVEVVGKY